MCEFPVDYSISVPGRENTLEGLQIHLSGYHVCADFSLVKSGTEKVYGVRTS